ncbi:hypothetical protein BH10CYA1_BH10CYA1_16270 [soil metagenome]
MGSSKVNGDVRSEKMVTMKTDLFKDRLNRVYERLRHGSQSRNLAESELFEYLWDLKETALMEGKRSLELPQTWLEKLEQEEATVSHTRN